jgi:hypothetical protein
MIPNVCASGTMRTAFPSSGFERSGTCSCLQKWLLPAMHLCSPAVSRQRRLNLTANAYFDDIYRMYVLQYDEGQPQPKVALAERSGTCSCLLRNVLPSDASMFSSDASIRGNERLNLTANAYFDDIPDVCASVR